MSLIRIFILAALLCGAQSHAALQEDHRPTADEWWKAGAMGVVGVAGSATFMYAIPTPTCVWCGTNTFDESITKEWVWERRGDMRTFSDIVTFGLAPALALGTAGYAAGSWPEFALHTLVLADSILFATAVSELVKHTARRERPEALYQYEDYDPGDANLSFPSGHTVFAFSVLSTASVLVFQKRYAWAPYFTTIAAVVGLGVGYTRIAAGKHWVSDVLVGMGLGIGVGVATPFFVYRNDKDSGILPKGMALAPMTNRPGILLSYRW